jgi:hypothetical protein
MAASPEEQMATMAANLKANTGKTLEQWSTLVRKSGKTKHGEVVSWLKADHGVTHGYANFIAHSTFKSDAGSQVAGGADLVSEMFAGDKAAMRPIFDALMKEIRSFGGDVVESPKKGYLSLRRSTQFATLRRRHQVERDRSCRPARSRRIMEWHGDSPRSTGVRRRRRQGAHRLAASGLHGCLTGKTRMLPRATISRYASLCRQGARW